MPKRQNGPVGRPRYWTKAKAALSAADQVLAGVIERHPQGCLAGQGDAYITLARSIVAQQVSVRPDGTTAVGRAYSTSLTHRKPMSRAVLSGFSGKRKVTRSGTGLMSCWYQAPPRSTREAWPYEARVSIRSFPG